MLKDLFVPYEIAVILKELGFKNQCFGWYNNVPPEAVIVIFNPENTSMDYNSNLNSNCHAPIYQQALDFLRTNHKIEIVVLESYETPGKFESTIYTTFVEDEVEFGSDNHTDYYSCLNEAIMEACTMIQKSKEVAL